jgi:carboxylate-amine ligase
VRYGLEGKMIDFGKQTEVPVHDLVLELLEFVDDVVDELGSRKEIDHVHTILKRGTSADRQLQVYRETNDLTAVVDDLIKMTMENVSEMPDLVTPHPTTIASTISK